MTVTTAVPGLVLMPSERNPAYYHVLSGWGTPFPAHVQAVCPASDAGHDCRHLIAAMEAEPMTTPDTTALARAENSPTVQRAAQMQLRAGQHVEAWTQFLALGKGFLASGLLPEVIKSPEAAALVLMKAYSLGVEPTEAFEFIDVIKGRPFVRSQMVRALVARSGLGRIEVTERGATKAVCVGIRKGWAPCKVTYTIEDAKAAGLLSNANYQKFPADMLVARAAVRVGRYMFPDVLSGMDVGETLAGEYAVVDTLDEPGGGDVEVLEGTFTEIPDGDAVDVATGEIVDDWFDDFQQQAKALGISGHDIAAVIDAPVATPEAVHGWCESTAKSLDDLLRLAADKTAAAQ